MPIVESDNRTESPDRLDRHLIKGEDLCHDLKKAIREYSVEIFFFIVSCIILVPPYLIRIFHGTKYVNHGPIFVLLILAFLVIFRPDLLCKLSPKGRPKFYFKDRPYFENYDNRIATFVRSIRKLSLLWIFAIFGIWSHFHFSKEIAQKNCPIFANCFQPTYHEKDYLQENGTFVVGLAFSLSTILLTAYWNLDSTYGRKWSYICGLYKDFISISDETYTGTKKKEIVRINLCIDILDHALWNSKQFRVFFTSEMEKYFYFLLNNSDVLFWIESLKPHRSDDLAVISDFMKEFHTLHITPILNDSTSENAIELKFDSLRKTLTLIYEFMEKLESTKFIDLDKYPALDRNPSTLVNWQNRSPYL